MRLNVSYSSPQKSGAVSDLKKKNKRFQLNVEFHSLSDDVDLVVECSVYARVCSLLKFVGSLRPDRPSAFCARQMKLFLIYSGGFFLLLNRKIGFIDETLRKLSAN